MHAFPAMYHGMSFSFVSSGSEADASGYVARTSPSEGSARLGNQLLNVIFPVMCLGMSMYFASSGAEAGASGYVTRTSPSEGFM